MDVLSEWLLPVLRGGAGNLAAYLAAHVLLCLLPAFFIAGAMSALIPQQTITRFLGRNSPRHVSYPAAAAAGSLLAVCSCTIVPLFAGIYKKGAGLGPAITFLFFAPAANILALVYTGGIIGPDLAIARFLLSLIFGIGIGLIMALLFRADDVAHDQATDSAFGAAGSQGMGRAALVFLLTWVALLLAGTLKLGVLTGSWFQFELPLSAAETWQAGLDQLVPFDAGKGEEGVSVQGVLLIGLLVAIGASAWRGIENIQSGANRWTGISLGLIALTLLLSLLSGVILMGVVFVPQLAENALQLPSGSGGYLVIILGLASGVGAPLSGRLTDQFGPKLVLAVGASISALAAVGVIAWVIPSPGYPSVIVTLILIGLGLGFVIGSPLNYLMLRLTPAKQSNSALGTLSLVRSIGTTLAPVIMVGFLAHAGGLVQDRLTAQLPSTIKAPELPYAATLQATFDTWKADDRFADALKGVEFPDLSGKTTIAVNTDGAAPCPMSW